MFLCAFFLEYVDDAVDLLFYLNYMIDSTVGVAFIGLFWLTPLLALARP